ncbi:hypothetical protein quinque_009615 [Culex quinquefasciatus]
MLKCTVCVLPSLCDHVPAASSIDAMDVDEDVDLLYDALEEIIDHSALFGRPDARQDKVNDQLFKASHQKRFLLANAFNSSVHVSREMPRWIPKFGTCLFTVIPPKYQEACQKCLQLPACFVDVKLTVAFPTLAAMSYNPAPVPGGRRHP